MVQEEDEFAHEGDEGDEGDFPGFTVGHETVVNRLEERVVTAATSAAMESTRAPACGVREWCVVPCARRCRGCRARGRSARPLSAAASPRLSVPSSGMAASSVAAVTGPIPFTAWRRSLWRCSVASSAICAAIKRSNSSSCLTSVLRKNPNGVSLTPFARADPVRSCGAAKSAAADASADLPPGAKSPTSGP